MQRRSPNPLGVVLGVCVTLLVSTLGVSAGEAVPREIRDALATLLPGVEADKVGKSPIPGLYEVVLGPHVIYMSEDGKHMVQGDVIDVATKQNLTEGPRMQARIDAIQGLGEANMVVFSPAETKHTVTVFTDVDCGYCRKLHSEIKSYTDLGIKVRYVAFPRAGVGSRSYDTLVSVWCADDRQTAMTRAKGGKPIDARTCTNPVRDQFTMGRLLGVNGTPTIITEDGQVMPGYVPAQRLAGMLEAG